MNVLRNEKECYEKECKNKIYGYDQLTPNIAIALCRKHYRMYALGWSEYEARKGRRT